MRTRRRTHLYTLDWHRQVDARSGAVRTHATAAKPVRARGTARVRDASHALQIHFPRARLIPVPKLGQVRAHLCRRHVSSARTLDTTRHTSRQDLRRLDGPVEALRQVLWLQVLPLHQHFRKPIKDQPRARACLPGEVLAQLIYRP
jgi:hypothetical protein